MTADLKVARERLENLSAFTRSRMKHATTGQQANDLRDDAEAIDALLTALDQAAEALEPFGAVMREHYEDLPPDPSRHAWGFNGADLYWCDFIRAATVYATLKPEGEG